MLGALRGFLSQSKTTTEGKEDAVPWVVVAIAAGLEAEVYRSKLESHGVPCILQRESVGSVLGLTIGPLGETRVLVPEALAENALNILNEEHDELSDETDDADIYPAEETE